MFLVQLALLGLVAILQPDAKRRPIPSDDVVGQALQSDGHWRLQQDRSRKVVVLSRCR